VSTAGRALPGGGSVRLARAIAGRVRYENAVAIAEGDSYSSRPIQTATGTTRAMIAAASESGRRRAYVEHWDVTAERRDQGGVRERDADVRHS